MRWTSAEEKQKLQDACQRRFLDEGRLHRYVSVLVALRATFNFGVHASTSSQASSWVVFDGLTQGAHHPVLQYLRHHPAAFKCARTLCVLAFRGRVFTEKRGKREREMETPRFRYEPPGYYGPLV